MKTEIVFIPEYGMEYKIPMSWVDIVDHWWQDVHPTDVSFESEHPQGQSREWFEHCCESLCQDMGEKDYTTTENSTYEKPNVVMFYDEYAEEHYVFNCSEYGQMEFLQELCHQARKVGSDFATPTPYYYEV